MVGERWVVRATPEDLAGWQLPYLEKMAFIESGVPLIEGIVGAVKFRADPPPYRLGETAMR